MVTYSCRDKFCHSKIALAKLLVANIEKIVAQYKSVRISSRLQSPEHQKFNPFCFRANLWFLRIKLEESILVWSSKNWRRSLSVLGLYASIKTKWGNQWSRIDLTILHCPVAAVAMILVIDYFFLSLLSELDYWLILWTKKWVYRLSPDLLFNNRSFCKWTCYMCGWSVTGANNSGLPKCCPNCFSVTKWRH